MLKGNMFEIPSLSGHEQKSYELWLFTFRGCWRPQSASEVIQLYVPGLRLSRAFRIGMALGILLQIIVSRAL